jgi:hypothetical protein
MQVHPPKSHALEIISNDVIGWGYTAAWGISFLG